MRVFVTGATGWVGSAITKDLVETGHEVVGLVRSEEKARILAGLGGEPMLGSLSDPALLKAGAEAADGVIHTAFGAGLGQPAVFAQSAKEDHEAIEAFGKVFRGSDRPILVTGGIGVLPRGETFSEATPPSPPPPTFPRMCEQAALSVAQSVVRIATVRLPRAVHGAGETHGFIPRLMALARQKGVSAYVGDGQNLWPSVHRLDAARLYRLAIERGAEGGPFHAVAEEGVAFRDIAEAIGHRLDLPVISIAAEEAAHHFGPMAMPVSGNGAVSSQRTRTLLDWAPKELGLIDDIGRAESYP